MSSLDKETVRKIAHLSRINVSEEGLVELAGDLTRILDFVEELQEVDVEGYAPLTSVADLTLPLRKDEVTDGNIQQKVLANAPMTDNGCFVVPKVIE
ncbi:Asp-tRNA(Asn)/Glu-tRNA(Gln) amidotransferase subunit GatC [Thalassospira alkalitolerans]|uniref:Aspartyl/glutamyl-tRNA(Asn/Gln) amidotransferase subunit C n=1 Tax=Thalassospira alkalitolerans TaxID=1293890 RepID=A0A1Y2L8A1_9PROT|nr:Asp-tRNA(Asn)/Glu-tRNA(Gln) amidotransferase subunit GatC [Thalassospira alkalitolerans]OSQ45225.1 glutamyl-tRNA amidotransferase [Thalassospira alkalitolerans]|tara:strand:- start:88725 stop:89015 length:291 start_codon:yes stop_codon:yes gene_type:complete